MTYSKTMAIEIRQAKPDEIPIIVDFITAARLDTFPMIDENSHARTAKLELANFQQTYLDHPDGAFLVAYAEGTLVGTIAYVVYDYRFPQLQLGDDRVVEVIRLYVHPDWRRGGLGSKLFASLEEEARQEGIQRLYLHTHPFLPGAIRFWEQQGFAVIHKDDDPVWHTTHMVSQPLDGRETLRSEE